MTTAAAREIAFPPYTEYDPEVPVWCIAPGSGPTIQRFFDTSPVSPSGERLMLVLRRVLLADVRQCGFGAK